jgi:malate dehydrogenase (oxaloacetate-decarboxylating)
LAFPGIFRGVLDVRARRISDEMAVAAALELARCAELRGLTEEHILPALDEEEVPLRLAVATGLAAQQAGLAERPGTAEELEARAEHLLQTSREMFRTLVGEGLGG